MSESSFGKKCCLGICRGEVTIKITNSLIPSDIYYFCLIDGCNAIDTIKALKIEKDWKIEEIQT